MRLHKIIARYPLLSLFIVLIGLVGAPTLAQAAAPAILYSDLDSGPKTGGLDNKGVFVTVWGKNFGTSQGTVTVGGGAVDNYLLWSDSKIIFQLGANAATGNIAVRSAGNEMSNGIPFTVRSGRIFFVSPSGTGNGSLPSTPMSPSAAYGVFQAGDTYYFRSGIYSARYGDTNWSNSNYSLGPTKSGTAGNPVALVGYPNEVAEFRTPGGTSGDNINLRDSSNRPAGYVTIANLTLVGTDTCIGSGGVTVAFQESAKSGAPGMRVVGNVMRATYSGNTMSAVMQVSNDGGRVFGNEFKDTGVDPSINNNHAIYINLGASDVDVGWNYFHNLRMGHVIQVHTDTYFVYTNVRIHDNVITATNLGDSRGINVGNVSPGSYGAIYNNVLYNLGQNFSAIALFGGDWKVYNNTLFNIRAGTGMVWLDGEFGGRPTAQIYNNIFYSDGTSPYVGVIGGLAASSATLSNNLYFNRGNGPASDPAAINADPMFINPAAGNFRLQSGSSAIRSSAINRGTSAVNTVVTMDRDGTGRPQDGVYDVGAYENSGASIPAPQNLRIQRNQ